MNKSYLLSTIPIVKNNTNNALEGYKSTKRYSKIIDNKSFDKWSDSLMQSITKMINCLTTARNNTTQQLNDHSSKTDQHISQPSYHSTGLLIDNQDKTKTPDIIVVYPDHDTKTTREDNKSANLLIDNCSPKHIENKSDDTQKNQRERAEYSLPK